MLSTKNITNITKLFKQIKSLTWWQKIIALLVGLYVFKYLLDAFKITNTIRALADMKSQIIGNTETFDGEEGAGTLNCTMYYAPWCGHCKTAKPEWEKLEGELNGKTINGISVNISKIDCDQNPKVAEEQGIQGFPTFKFEMNGKYLDYNGGRTYSEFKQYIESVVQ